MPSEFSGINTALRGLQAQQKALQTTSHNVANANTEGYTRQQVVMSATMPLPVPSMNQPGGAGQYGTGVQVDEIRRVRDEFLDTQLRKEMGTLDNWKKQEEVFNRIEVVFMEPSESGLSSLMNQFWSSWQELSKNANSESVRTTVRETSKALADAIRHTHRSLGNISSDLSRSLEIKVDEVNGSEGGNLASQIADLNGKIASVRLSGDQPNDLMDQRDLLLDDLAKHTNFTLIKKSDGTVNVEMGSLNDHTGAGDLQQGRLYTLDVGLPDTSRQVNINFEGGTDEDSTGGNIETALKNALGNSYAVNLDTTNDEITIEDENGNTSTLDLNNFGTNPPRQAIVAGENFDSWQVDSSSNIVWEDGSNDNVGEITDGELQGIQQALDKIEDYKDRLNDFVDNLSSEVNDIHRDGYGLNGNTGLDFFVSNTGSGAIDASNIAVNEDFDTDIGDIAAATEDPTVDAGPGDGSNALKIAQLKEEGIQGNYENIISRLGVESHEAKRMVENQQVLVDQLSNNRDSKSGVSLDEEMAHMVQYQHAYNASARVTRTIDEMLDTLINRMF